MLDTIIKYEGIMTKPLQDLTTIHCCYIYQSDLACNII